MPAPKACGVLCIKHTKALLGMLEEYTSLSNGIVCEQKVLEADHGWYQAITFESLSPFLCLMTIIAEFPKAEALAVVYALIRHGWPRMHTHRFVL